MRSHRRKQVEWGAASWPCRQVCPGGQSTPSEAWACRPHPAGSARALPGACGEHRAGSTWETPSREAAGLHLEWAACVNSLACVDRLSLRNITLTPGKALLCSKDENARRPCVRGLAWELGMDGWQERKALIVARSCAQGLLPCFPRPLPGTALRGPGLSEQRGLRPGALATHPGLMPIMGVVGWMVSESISWLVSWLAS